MAMANYLRNKIVDWLLRGQAFSPPATVYYALCTSAPTAAAAGTEVSTVGTGYARQGIASSLANMSGTQGAGTTVASSGTSGASSNNATVNYGTATADWGTVSHWEAYDAATAGNRLFWGSITDGSGNPSPRSVSSGDPVSFPAGTLEVDTV